MSGVRARKAAATGLMLLGWLVALLAAPCVFISSWLWALAERVQP